MILNLGIGEHKMDTDNVIAVCATICIIAFFILMAFLAIGSDSKFEVCVKAGHSWIDGNCIVKDMK